MLQNKQIKKMNLLNKIINDCRGFTIEMALMVIIIMSGVCILVVTVMTMQNQKTKISNTLINQETVISQYGEDFYNVCKYVAWGTEGVTTTSDNQSIKDPNLDLGSTDPLKGTLNKLDNYKRYLEKTFYAEPASEEREEDTTLIWSSTPSNGVGEDYFYQPVNVNFKVTYYYSYNIKEYSDAYELTLSFHKATNNIVVYGINEKAIVENAVPNNTTYYYAIEYSSEVVLSVKVQKTIVSGNNNITIGKWYYNDPTEINTNSSKTYLPYVLNPEEEDSKTE